MNNGLFDKLNQRGGHYALLLGAGALVFLVNLGVPSLWDLDEGRNATAAYEMMSGGDWIVPTFNSELRVDKPALLYWLQIAAYCLFGVNEFSARLPSALAALAMLLVCYELGRRMFSGATGLIAGLILAGSPMVCAAARFANPDSLLNLFTVLCLALFWMAYDASQKRASSRQWLSIVGMLGAGSAAGLAVLAKGPVGIVLPGAVVVLFLLWNRQLSVVFNRRLPLAIIAFLIIAAPWYVLVTVDSKGEFAEGFLLKHNLQRFASTMESHRGGPFYYLIVLLVGTAPWSVFLLSSVVYSARLVFRRLAVSRELEKSSAYRFLWCWIAVYLVFFSISATKLPNYILPMVAAAAILMARFLDRWRSGELTLPRWHMPLSFSEIAVIGAVLAAGMVIGSGVITLSVLRGRAIAGLETWAFAGLAPMLGAACAWWFYRRNQRTAVIGSIVLSTAATLAIIAGWGIVAVENNKAVRVLVAQSGARQPEREIRVGCLQLEYLPSFNFYCQRDVKHCKNDAEMLLLLRQPLPVYVFMPASKWDVLARKVTVPHRVLARHRDLYKNHDVVVVTNSAAALPVRVAKLGEDEK